MSKYKFIIPFSILLLLALRPAPSPAQLVLGQYEEEAPVRTWNIFGFVGAAGLARGETMFTLASDASVLFTNPSLMTRLPNLMASVNGSLLSAEFFKYGLVNTGVLSSDRNLSLNLYALDMAAATLRVWGWRLGLGLALTELYERPEAAVSSTQYDYNFSFRQTGLLRTWNLSLAREIMPGFAIGLGFNLISGRWEWQMEDSWNTTSQPITITDDRSRDFSGSYFNGGLIWKISQKISLAAAFRTPYKKKSASRSQLRYQAPSHGTDIRIEAEAEDIFRQPLVLGMGLTWEISYIFKVVGEASYWNWSSYQATSFGEALSRDFQDTWKAGLGLEIGGGFRLFKQHIDFPSRIGVAYDPQPMENPQSVYLHFTIGTGIHWKGVHLDIGTLAGSEQGSGRRLAVKRFALTLTLHPGPQLVRGKKPS